MNDKPLLILPRPSRANWQRKGHQVGKPHFPSPERQRTRITPQFERLESALEARRLILQQAPEGAAPEQVLVLEIVGTIQDFLVAVRGIPGMEWLGEWEEEDIPPDEDFFLDEKHKDKALGGRLFLVMTDHRATQELLSLWQRYQKNPEIKFGYGRNKWRELFQQLRTIRFWEVQDRLLETGVLEDWKERIRAGEENIRFEAELWFRNNTQQQQKSHQTFETLLQQAGGRLISQTVIPEIAYQGLLAELPIKAIQSILENPDTSLVQCDQVMFFRATGQSTAVAPEDEPLIDSEPIEDMIKPQGAPVVALLDGLPVENHLWLNGRLLIDDPDNWSAEYLAQNRHHGTAMASLILHGELDDHEQSLARPLYVRPILKPDMRDWRSPKAETMPENVLPVDLIHRAVRRLFDGEGSLSPVSPDVCVINFSIGDPARQFDRFMSPMARLLDWLAWCYQVLFVVSAGNHSHDLVLDVPRASLAQITPNELENETIKAIARDARHRRLLAPAESVNALTVGALHADHSKPEEHDRRINPFHSNDLPSPTKKWCGRRSRAVNFMIDGFQKYCSS